MIQGILTGVALLICTCTDVYWRRIYRGVLIGYAALAFVGHLLVGDMGASLLYGLVPGLTCLAVGFATHQSFGYGDGFLILVMGFSLGFPVIVNLLYLSFLFVGIFAVFLLITRKGERKSEIPFAPFLLAGAAALGLGAYFF